MKRLNIFVSLGGFHILQQSVALRSNVEEHYGRPITVGHGTVTALHETPLLQR